MTNPDERAEIIEEEAAAWVIRRGGADYGPMDQAQFDAWRTLTPENEAAFRRAESTWRQMAGLDAEKAAIGIGTASSNPRPPIDRAAQRRKSNRSTVARRLAAGIAMAASVLGFAYINVQYPVALLAADHMTGAGEYRTVTLSDGSTVSLNTRSAIDVDFGADARRLELLGGEAVFTVAPDKDRPFIVEFGSTRVRALGTRFIVKQQDGGASVIVLEHSVRVSSDPSDIGVATGDTVSDGQVIFAYPDGTRSAVSRTDLSAATAWRRGALLFDRQPVGQVIRELNRHRGGYTVIANEDLSNKELSGMFRLDRLDDAIERIAREIGATHSEIVPGISVLR